MEPYTCINSLRPLPYVKAWADKYRAAGLVVIGVHTPEFSVEKEPANVERPVRDLKVTYPLAVDSDYRIWEAFDNQYWPALYFIDAKGRIRHHYFGEGQYAEAERVLQELLKESETRLAGPRASIKWQRNENAQQLAIGLNALASRSLGLKDRARLPLGSTRSLVA